MKTLMLIGSLFFSTTLFLSSCGSSDNKDNDLSKVRMVFDVSSLVGQDIDEVRMVLAMSGSDEGAEPTKEEMKLKPTSWDDFCDRGGHWLLITYNPMNRKVLEYFIATPNPSGVTADYSDLLKICNIKKGDLRYSIVPVRATDDEKNFTGIRIVVK